MNARRGEIWLANLNPIKGSEQAGTRPVLIFQNDLIKDLRPPFLRSRLQQTCDEPRCLLASQFHKAKADSPKIQLHFAINSEYWIRLDCYEKWEQSLHKRSPQLRAV